ncbi:MULTISPECIES: hypothetical protein [Vibrio]|uniref:hypothetical protein n=1 Tax=Vibrio TaxID=662 RepID=UPI0001B99AFC|nr:MULTISPECIES: hypothetical protein [Vibrio]HAS2379469.1 hypothetical protein [Vibrio cholerae O1]EEX66992.1 hypothetical protein VCJ_000616 [Vibrio metoecus]EEX67332.1 hypothetical protein VCJ_000492 [Vibrio metoecus]EHS1094317.1 hypothetical protein [Vibrio cholerae]EHZ6902517.1 hypothetical protein [Vibrio cholerae]
MDSVLVSALTGLSGDVSPVLVLWTGYLLLKTTRTITEHDKRISKLEWEQNNG